MPESLEEQRWRAENDASTLAEAAAIRADALRFQAAQVAAKELTQDAQERAYAAIDKAKAMEKLADGTSPAGLPSNPEAGPSINESFYK